MAKTLICTKTQAEADSGKIRFVHGEDSVVMDNTYKVYEFYLVNMHPSNDASAIQFQVDVSGSTSYNQNITSSFFRTKNHEDGSSEEVAYIASYDQADGTSYQLLCNDVGFDDDQSVSGLLTLYEPSSGTFVKHFMSRMSEVHESNIMMDSFCAGFIDETAAIDKIQFEFDAGTIQTGTIYMYGVS
jgi:hypothetical protein|tara:strand:+ start:281 stop:838 length:558 start_codon:yes stop_codon:yes gene_type:complete